MDGTESLGKGTFGAKALTGCYIFTAPGKNRRTPSASPRSVGSQSHRRSHARKSPAEFVGGRRRAGGQAGDVLACLRSSSSRRARESSIHEGPKYARAAAQIAQRRS